MDKSIESPSTTPSGWKIKIRSHSNSSNSSQPPLPITPLIESDTAFDRRLDLWAQTSTFQNIASHICHDVEKDMLRRQQPPPAKQQNGDTPLTSSSANSPITNGNSTAQLQRDPDQRRSTMGDMAPFVFENPSILTDREYSSWVQNGKEVHHPHQWLKLASLFHIHPKTAHQRSLMTPAAFQAAKIDRQVNTEVNRKQLENYLDLRRAQNRNYAENAVAEGVKLYDAKKVNEAQEFYKRALDMDPQYAEGWYRVAESLLQQKRTSDAILQLQKALRIEPTHENAKALLCTLENTTSYTSPLVQQTPKSTEPRDEKNTIDKESDRKHVTRDDDDDEKDRHRHKKRRQDSRHESKRRSRHSVSPSSTRRRARRSASPPDRKSKRSRRSPSPHDEKRSRRSPSPHDEKRPNRHASLSPLDDTSSRSKKHRDDRRRSSSPRRDKPHDEDDSSRHRRHRSSRSKEKSPKRRHHRHHHKERSSKKSSHHHDSSKRSNHY